LSHRTTQQRQVQLTTHSRAGMCSS
jgi:hypothetical protein